MGLQFITSNSVIIDEDDLVSAAFFDLGRRAAISVVKLLVRSEPRRKYGFATGFMVGPGLLLTNRHVLRSEEHALRTCVEFGPEQAQGEAIRASVVFALEPSRCFFSSEDLDYSLVAVAPRSLDGQVDLSRYGWLRLKSGERESFKTGSFVNIIQYPAGGEKQASFRDNKVIPRGNLSKAGAKNPGSRLWYRGDTATCSSGSPVFNDSWQVVALHSNAAFKRDASGKIVLKDGRVLTDEEAALESALYRVEVANEGIVGEFILQDLEEKQLGNRHPMLSALLKDAKSGGGPFGEDSTYPHPEEVPVSAAAVVSRERRGLKTPRDLSGRDGYQPGFLNLSFPIPLPDCTLAEQAFGPAARLQGEAGIELKYRNFSIVMCERRRLAFFTAVNIDGRLLVGFPHRVNPEWIPDPRLAKDAQVLGQFYQDRSMGMGHDHLVRRLDPVWGAYASQAHSDTFYFTNRAPQFFTFNPGENWWQGLENHILHSKDALDWKVTVFTGPVFHESDRIIRGIQVPEKYWKVVAFRDQTGSLLVTGFVVQQKLFPVRLDVAAIPLDGCNGFQVPVEHIEDLTRLKFSDATRAADSALRQQLPPGGRRIRWYHDVLL